MFCFHTLEKSVALKHWTKVLPSDTGQNVLTTHQNYVPQFQTNRSNQQHPQDVAWTQQSENLV